MADNTTLNTGTGGDVIATDDLTTLNGGASSGVKVQRVKVGSGADGAFNDASVATPLPIQQYGTGVASTVNSTATNLAAFNSFLGTSEDVSEYASVSVSVFCDVPSTTNGVLLQFSYNGTSWDFSRTYSAAGGASGFTFTSPVLAKFFRLNYSTDSATTTLHIQTTFHKSQKATSVNRPSDAKSNEFSAEDVVAHAMGYDATSATWNRIRTTSTGVVRIAGGALSTSSTNFAAAGTGTTGPISVSDAGNVTFFVKNQIAATAFTGAPVLVFEQSDDGTSWGPLPVQRSDNNALASTHTLQANVANGSFAFNAAMPGITNVRVRVTTGTATNGMTIVTVPGTMPFQPVVSVVDRKDAGRVAKTITLDSFAIAATTETLHTMSFSSANAAVTTGTSYNVTAGKTFRVQSIVYTLHTIASNTTAVNVIVRIRANAAGAAIVTSPLQLVTALQGIAAANSAAPPVNIQVPDGWEFPGGTGIGFTSICAGFVTTTAAPKLDITLIGYEY